MRVKFENVTKRFGSTTVVDDLSLSIREGEFVVLLGPSGCGKTTSLRMLAGLEDATSGEILIGDERVNDVPPSRRDVAMVFQSYALYPHMSVAENIAYPLRVRKTPREETAQRVARAASMLEIESLLGRRPRDLSGGERQRVALARAVVREPRVFLMDEPLSNLDARLRIQTRGELKRLQKTLGVTTIYVTHDQTEAMTLAHRVAVMKDGRLQQFDSPEEIYNKPANRFVAQFVGSPPMSFIEGLMDESTKTFVFANGGCALPIPQSVFARLAGRDRATLGIRPEHVRVSHERVDSGLETKVYVTELLGSETLIFLEFPCGARIVARAGAEFRVEPETTVWAKFETERAHFFDPYSGEALR